MVEDTVAGKSRAAEIRAGVPERGPRSPRSIRATRARLYVSVRTAHLERALELEPAAIVYLRRRYDFQSDLASELELHRTTMLGVIPLMLRSGLREVEVNEPLSPGSVFALAALAGLAMRRMVGAPRVVVSTYAIENLDPASVRRDGVKARARAWLHARSARILWSRLDRIAYGTDASRSLYERRFPARSSITATTIPALPPPLPVTEAQKRAASVVFLGALVPRKGFPLVLDAWDQVRRRRPDATLTIVGKGRLVDRAAELARTDPSVTLIEDPPRARIFEELAAMRVLVLPSQPMPSWREQVGLPIVEGLSAGCSIVTTSETGLAAWLRAHGHEVLASDAGSDALADAIVRILDGARSAASVQADLPEVDGRLAADRWLFGKAR